MKHNLQKLFSAVQEYPAAALAWATLGLQKLDALKKNWKRHSTSAVFVALVVAFESRGINLSQHIESVESFYAALSVSYAGVMTFLKLIADKASK
mgnify:CR=1 FL=1